MKISLTYRRTLSLMWQEVWMVGLPMMQVEAYQPHLERVSSLLFDSHFHACNASNLWPSDSHWFLIHGLMMSSGTHVPIGSGLFPNRKRERDFLVALTLVTISSELYPTLYQCIHIQQIFSAPPSRFHLDHPSDLSENFVTNKLSILHYKK